jgi:hypothetical protein
MSYQKPIYIISVSKPMENTTPKFYLTNRTNVKATWEVVQEHFGIDSDTEHCLVLKYAEKGSKSFLEIPARKAKIKSLCLDSVRNSVILFPENDEDNRMKITMDYVGGGI